MMLHKDLCYNCKFAEYDADGCYCKKHTALVYGISTCNFYDRIIICNTCKYANQVHKDCICYCNYYGNDECRSECSAYIEKDKQEQTNNCCINCYYEDFSLRDENCSYCNLFNDYFPTNNGCPSFKQKDSIDLGCEEVVKNNRESIRNEDVMDISNIAHKKGYDVSDVSSNSIKTPIKCTCGGNPTISIETDNESFYLYKCECVKCNKDVSIRLTTLTIFNLNTVISLWNEENIDSILKPCPFCGGEAELKDGVFSVCGEYQNIVYIRCKDCGAMVKVPNKDINKLSQYKTECRTLWNKRTEE